MLYCLLGGVHLLYCLLSPGFKQKGIGRGQTCSEAHHMELFYNVNAIDPPGIPSWHSMAAMPGPNRRTRRRLACAVPRQQARCSYVCMLNPLVVAEATADATIKELLARVELLESGQTNYIQVVSLCCVHPRGLMLRSGSCRCCGVTAAVHAAFRPLG